MVAEEEPDGPAAAGGAGAAAGEEEQVELHGLMTQVFELLLCAVERPQYQRALEPALGQLTQVCITYMQVGIFLGLHVVYSPVIDSVSQYGAAFRCVKAAWSAPFVRLMQA